MLSEVDCAWDVLFRSDRLPFTYCIYKFPTLDSAHLDLCTQYSQAISSLTFTYQQRMLLYLEWHVAPTHKFPRQSCTSYLHSPRRDFSRHSQEPPFGCCAASGGVPEGQRARGPRGPLRAPRQHCGRRAEGAPALLLILTRASCSRSAAPPLRSAAAVCLPGAAQRAESASVLVARGHPASFPCMCGWHGLCDHSAVADHLWRSQTSLTLGEEMLQLWDIILFLRPSRFLLAGGDGRGRGALLRALC